MATLTIGNVSVENGILLAPLEDVTELKTALGKEFPAALYAVVARFHAAHIDEFLCRERCV